MQNCSNANPTNKNRSKREQRPQFLSQILHSPLDYRAVIMNTQFMKYSKHRRTSIAPTDINDLSANMTNHRI